MIKTSFYSTEELKEMEFKTIGKNVLISRKTSIYNSKNISLGDNVRIDDFSLLSGGKGIQIGSCVHIASFCALYGGEGIKLEDFSGLSSRVVIYSNSDDYSGEFLTNPTIPEEFRQTFGGLVTLGKHVIVGTGTTILPNITIGKGSSIAAMSLVNKSLGEWGIYAGIPVKFLKERKKNLIQLEKKMLKN
ncbi:acyltransferase [Neobacillus sp. PS3-12]|uniref:acyltransferase n=1 Tax=Neobacillus sp. PS3-12 TaxID=3070677 RepID=UPI0027DF1264|nr:acyltransferase [Neobacillus sp. PS3-12]WML53096.1 acyltransferase [Neobacillus sp. PS3-12]